MRNRRLVLFDWRHWSGQFPDAREIALRSPGRIRSATGGLGQSRSVPIGDALVLVDTVVTDKHGNYLRDLEQKDFRVWEDGKEQALTSFSYEENTGSPTNSKPRYMVLFFDNSTMDRGDQIKARDAAAKFIDANAGPDRLIAIADFGGTVHISQNFTSDASRLKQVVAGLKGSAVSPNADPVTVASLAPPTIGPSLGNAEADFGVHTVLLALRSIAKGMSGVPGRKTLVMLTSGFPMNPEYQSELTAVIDTCNKSNVAIYPIDVRGLTVPGISAAQESPHSHLVLPSVPFTSGSLTPATLHFSGTLSQYPILRLAAFAEPALISAPTHWGRRRGDWRGWHGGRWSRRRRRHGWFWGNWRGWHWRWSRRERRHRWFWRDWRRW